MSTDVLRGRVHHDVSAPLKRADEVRGRDSVVDDERHPDLVGDSCHSLDVEDVVLGVRDRLAVEQLGVRAHGCTPRVKIVRILDKRDLNAELRQRVVEEVVGAAVEARARHHVIADLSDVEDREHLCSLATGYEQRSNATFERSEAVLDYGLRRVHDARVNVAQFLQRKQIRSMRRVIEGVRRRLVNRQSPCVCCGVR